MELRVGLGQRNRYKPRILKPRQHIFIITRCAVFCTAFGKRNINGAVEFSPLRILIHLGNKTRNISFKGVDIGEEWNNAAFPAVLAQQSRIEILQYLRIIAVPLNLPSDNAELIQLLRGKLLRILVSHETASVRSTLIFCEDVFNILQRRQEPVNIIRAEPRDCYRAFKAVQYRSGIG